MTVAELRETMKERGITVAQLAEGSGYSYSFASRMLNHIIAVESLPVRIRRTLESLRLIAAEIIPPTDRQLALLIRLGCQQVPACRAEASAMIDSLISQRAFERECVEARERTGE